MNTERNPKAPVDAVVGIFQNRTQAETAVERLKAAAFSGQDISVLFPDKGSTTTFAKEEGTKASEDALKGVSTGGILGGLTGWLVGIGALAIPGLGPFIAAGPIMGLLGGAALGGTVGGLTGALIGMGVPEEKARQYETGIKQGHILITVHSPTYEERLRAKEILQACGASDLTMTGGPSVAGSGYPSEAMPAESAIRSTRERGAAIYEQAKGKVVDTVRDGKEEIKETYREVRDRKLS
jgi:hypothetical protein